MTQLEFNYGGAKTLVALHEQYLREFLQVWREADAQKLPLPVTPDPNYASREALLAHVMGCAARYLDWICEKLEIAAPEVELRPDPEGFADRAESYMESVLAAWPRPLSTLTEARAYRPAHESAWGPPFCLDAMLEHAVMHPIRHSYQLRKLMDTRKS